MKGKIKRFLKRFKRCLAILLCVCMATGSFSTSALAYVGDLLANTPEENSRLLQELSELSGDDYDEVLAFLKEYNLLDENGDLNISKVVTMDGKEYSLEELLTLLEDESTDLSQTVTVDGTPIELGDLKTIIDIELELSRIRETYFSGKTFSEESLDSLNSLMNQIEAKGISLNAGGTIPKERVLDLTGFDNLTYDISNVEYMYEFKVYQNESLIVPAGETVSFDWTIDCGMLTKDYFSAELLIYSLDSAIGSREDEYTYAFYKNNTTDKASNTQTVTLTNDSFLPMQYNMILTIYTGNLYELTSQTQYPTLNKPLSDETTYGISGDLSGCVEFSNPVNITFYDGTKLTDAVKIFSTVEKENAFKYVDKNIVHYTNWLTSWRSLYHEMQLMVDEKNPIWVLYHRPDLFHNDITNYMDNVKALSETAKQVFGGDKQPYIIEASLAIVGTKKEKNGSITSSLPMPYNWGGDIQLDVLSYKNCGILLDLKGILDAENKNEGKLEQWYVVPIHGKIQEYGYAYYSHNVTIEVLAPTGVIPGQLKTNWPGNPKFKTFAKNSKPVGFSEKRIEFTEESCMYLDFCDISLNDTTAPTINEVKVPDGTYYSRQLVPITIDFSEPVDASKLSLEINNHTYTSESLHMTTTGKTAKGWYQVQDIDNTELIISKITGIKDICGNNATEDTSNNNGEGWKFTNAKLESTLMRNAVSGVSASYNKEDGMEHFTLTVNQEEAYRTAYGDYDNGNKAPFKAVITGPDGKETEEMFYLKAEDGSKIVEVEASSTVTESFTDDTYTVDIFAYDRSGDVEAKRLIGMTTTFAAPKRISATGVKINYPKNDKDTLSLSEAYRPVFTAEIEPAETTVTGEWSSSDEEIATINDTGEVVLTGRKIGQVSFTYTIENDPANKADNITETSKTYTVTAGNSLALIIPDNANNIVIRKGKAANVLWSSNAVHFASGQDFAFRIELFQGKFDTEAELNGETPIKVWNDIESTANQFTIPAEYLTELGTPAYTVRISMPHPNALAENIRLTALSYITMYPAPATITLTHPDNLYLLDNEAVEIPWSIPSYVEGKTDATLMITRSTGNTLDKDNSSEVENVTLSGVSGKYTFTPAKVAEGDLKDTYTISIQAKNEGDEGWCIDSFPLYVYRNGTLELEIDGAKTGSITMNNVSTVESYTASSQSGDNKYKTEDILALRKELALIEYIGINYDDYSWNQLKDRISWESSNDSVTVNYKQGGLYEDIKNFGLASYLPETKMALSSVIDGTATITATHANTGMRASVDVDVHTLRNKFYLFQLTPMLRTALTYTDGKNATKTVYTNDEGVLALYEPNGIDSDVTLKAVDGNDVYLGTIYFENIRSGERDATMLQLYPLNTFKLRQVAKVDITLTKPDGTPYTGSVTLRGGVFKNGAYCQSALMNGNSADDLKDGKVDQDISLGSDGKLTVYLDSTQFWSSQLGENSADAVKLSAKDNLLYIFELTNLGENNSYYPVLHYQNGNLTISDVMRSAASVITLKTVEEGQKEKPFLSNQTMDYGISGNRLTNVLGYNGYVGPNSAYKDTTLRTTYLLWGRRMSTLRNIR